MIDVADRLTFHAIQRYRQRVEDVPVLVIAERIATPKVIAALQVTEESGGRMRIVLADKLRVCITAGRVTTVTVQTRSNGDGQQRIDHVGRRPSPRRAQHWRAALRRQGVI